ncbi:tRNA-U16,U17-dihydrouridine synthase [Palleronia marisminoris]|uniref:tRNA-dihydrouridine(20/20a) synthase n=1 Tax=Palleronia marisminoris TaxID=315423 RepID=A0A1Y5TCR5_9RHOB|nr:tRNA dihydrouridine(20/20a) synthase DusA [Palleronia marisminoris]SFH33253.1 tRNA-U16,U17-dihydrouridine synthase [Palleronia marisminoris]SLN60616.1 putative tRNA-dihydrouridine synthase [Palleronia marisminoris]
MTERPADLDTAARLSVAPMMDWTDRHCRVFHRKMSRHALLYTEMITAPALVRGGARHLIAFDDSEHPVALQLGGSDPRELAEAAKIGAEEGYDQIDLNCGCPSDRVQSGTFGAVLMRHSDLVADCAAEMIHAQGREVTVKCRIGVDEQEPEAVLPDFLQKISAAGVRRVTIHARKAWLQGLSPKENRDVPPLDYPLVHRMKAAFPDLHISINGGIDSLDAASAHLDALDGVMIGRAAYQRPADILLDADRRIFGDDAPRPTAEDVALEMIPYAEAHIVTGGRLHQVTRHMLGLFTGRPGARHWRRILSEGANRPGADGRLVEEALSAVTREVA